MGFQPGHGVESRGRGGDAQMRIRCWRRRRGRAPGEAGRGGGFSRSSGCGAVSNRGHLGVQEQVESGRRRGLLDATAVLSQTGRRRPGTRLGRTGQTEAQAFVVSGSSGDAGNHARRCVLAQAVNRASESNRRIAWSTARAAGSASDSFGGDACFGAFGRPVGVFDQEVVDGCVECGAGVSSSGFMPGIFRSGIVCTPDVEHPCPPSGVFPLLTPWNDSSSTGRRRLGRPRLRRS